MSIETAADRLLLLNDFGVSATHGGNTFKVIFDNDYLDADIGGSVAFAVSQPRATCRTADISTAAEGDAIVIEGLNYIVRVIMNDGTGMGVLVLEAQ